MQGTADVSDFDGSWGVEKFTLKTSDTSLYALDIGGVYKDLKKNDFVKVNAKLDINDPVGLGKALGIDLSGYSAYHSEGILTGNDDSISYTATATVGRSVSKTVVSGKFLTGNDDSISYTATATVGRSVSKTVVSGKLVKGRPTFKGKFEIPVLYLSDFGFNPKKDIDEPLDVDIDKKGSGDIFSKEPYDFTFLNSFDLDFDFLIDRVESHGQLAIDGITAHVRLKDGNLSVDPLKILVEGGSSEIVFGLQASDTPVLNLKVIADDMKLGPMMACG
jgi:hypothetical protein